MQQDTARGQQAAALVVLPQQASIFARTVCCLVCMGAETGRDCQHIVLVFVLLAVNDLLHRNNTSDNNVPQQRSITTPCIT